MQVDDSDSISEIGDAEKPVEVFHNGMNIIFVAPDPTDLKGNEKKQALDDEGSESVHSTSEEPPSLTDSSHHSVTKHRNVGCDNDAYDCLDEVEISELW